jgi:hypothetical protein
MDSMKLLIKKGFKPVTGEAILDKRIYNAATQCYAGMSRSLEFRVVSYQFYSYKYS